ncbi:MAG: sulfite exporter TauE/SafE family protein [Solirubrobacteraceae bacterium]
MERISLKHIGFTIIFLKIGLIIYLICIVLPTINLSTFNFDKSFYGFILAGFFAQMIDGALGMAYGVSCSTLLLNFGLSPKITTAAVHTAEVFTTGFSGLSHLTMNNIDKELFFKIVITGALGAVFGAYVISNFLDGDLIKPYISAYLGILGLIILVKGIRNTQKEFTKVKWPRLLAFFGGLMDAIGGGGWGPIVTSNIINQGKDPKLAIGTVNTAEFFVAFFSTGIFLFFVGIENWQVILGLIIGGSFAAPIGAYLSTKINKKALMVIVGVVLIAVSLTTVIKAIL